MLISSYLIFLRNNINFCLKESYKQYDFKLIFAPVITEMYVTFCSKQYLMKCQHYITNCVSRQNTCNYSLSAIDYNNYIDSYDLGKNLHLIPKLLFLFTILVEIEKWNVKENVNPCHSKKLFQL